MKRGGLVEAGLLAAFVLGFVLIGTPFLAHTIVGSAFAGLVALHFWQRRDRAARDRRLTAALLAGLLVVLVSGAFQLAGSQTAAPWHGGLSWLLTIALAVHLWRDRRALRFRLRSLRSFRGRSTRQRGDPHGS
ncbi:hypothetical protein [Nonomuraea sediminis]|uniref:hypothetical protein n=1 Tax=Nonomuraea sediminis TaxID=2835864 RepID=UPI001BDC6D09|nr:hypothetical protein [Nonomuraea sediminis]